MNLPGEICFVHCIIEVHDNGYIVMAKFPVRPSAGDSAEIAALAEFICRANYGLKNGNFELDFRDGEVRYKCFVDCSEQIPSQGIVRNSIAIPASMMARYSPGIINVLYKGMDAENAVKKCEFGTADSILRNLEEKLQRFKEQHSSDESESDEEDESEENDDGFPSFEEFLRMMEEARNEATEEEVDDTAE